ncbi:MAG: hypothetical protein WD359_03580 [Dehalococcoidia bacterium]
MSAELGLYLYPHDDRRGVSFTSEPLFVPEELVSDWRAAPRTGRIQDILSTERYLVVPCDEVHELQADLDALRSSVTAEPAAAAAASAIDFCESVKQRHLGVSLRREDGF